MNAMSASRLERSQILDNVESIDLFHKVQQFLVREARLLDEERYDDWLALLTEDVRYWMPGVQTRYRRDVAAENLSERMAMFDDDLKNLKRRVVRFQNETTWTEDPPTRHCHIVTNVEVEAADREDEVTARSIVISVRNRNEAEEDWVAARRKDRLRLVGDSLMLARREIHLTQSVFLSKNLNTFL